MSVLERPTCTTERSVLTRLWNARNGGRDARSFVRTRRFALESARRGFSFIELVVVASTIAILAAIAVPNFLEAQIRGAVARSRAELTTLHFGLEAYRADHRAYPPNRETDVPGQDDLIPLTTPIPYLSRLPLDFLTTGQARGRYAPPLDAIRYRWLNGLQSNPGEGIRFATGAEPAAFEGRVTGLLWGIGPHESNPAKGAAGGLDRDISIEPGARIELRIYDPTNGTTSRGQIAVSVP